MGAAVGRQAAVCASPSARCQEDTGLHAATTIHLREHLLSVHARVPGIDVLNLALQRGLRAGGGSGGGLEKCATDIRCRVARACAAVRTVAHWARCTLW